MKKGLLLFLIIFLVALPTFGQMLRPGIFSMQDFHYFRLVEFTKCVSDFQIPCRWAADSGAGYGEPVFNFYGQLSYIPGALAFLVGVSKIDALKLTFILSLVLSAIAMFFLAKKIWNNDLSALLSSVIYLYAPYRAVDVWVRGALPEAVSFIFFPVIILEIENYLETEKKKHLAVVSLFFGFLIINHNLSVILFAPFLIGWIVFRFFQIRKLKLFMYLGLSGLMSLGLAAFYILPVVFETRFIDISSTTGGVYDWRANFVTLRQLFLSRFWGYGGSTWGDGDGLSLAVGQIQWIIPLAIGISWLRKKKNKEGLTFYVLVVIGVFSLFLTHNKSTFIWNLLPFMKYIQFPWRFLAAGVFALSLASGLIIKYFRKVKLQTLAVTGIIFGVIILNFNFFRPDIWYKVSDRDLETGDRWIEATFSSLPDYWPNYGQVPKNEAFKETDDLKLVAKRSNSQTFEVKSWEKPIEFPVAYFPGWEMNYAGEKMNIVVSENGLISGEVREGDSKTVVLTFRDTPIRTVGNWISLVVMGVWILVFGKLNYGKKR